MTNRKLIERWREIAKSREIPRAVYFSNVDWVFEKLKITAPPFIMWNSGIVFIALTMIGAMLWTAINAAVGVSQVSIQRLFVEGILVGAGIACVVTVNSAIVRRRYQIGSWLEFRENIRKESN